MTAYRDLSPEQKQAVIHRSARNVERLREDRESRGVCWFCQAPVDKKPDGTRYKACADCRRHSNDIGKARRREKPPRLPPRPCGCGARGYHRKDCVRPQLGDSFAY